MEPITIYFFQLPGWEFFKKNQDHLLLSPWEKTALKKMKDTKRRLEFALSRHHLRKLIHELYQPKEKIFHILKNPKPLIDPKHLKNALFSFSHTQKAFVIALDSEEVGVDIENKNRAVSRALIHRFFTSDERKACIQLESQEPAELSQNTALCCWTRKEAISKLFGLALLSSFSQMNVLKSPLPYKNKKENKIFFCPNSKKEEKGSKNHWNQIHFKSLIHKDFIISLASKRQFNMNLKTRDGTDL